MAGLIVPVFKQDEQGRTLVFLWGALGRGRVVPTPEAAVWVRRYLKVCGIGVFVGCIPLVMFKRTDASMLLLAALLVVACVAMLPLWFRVRRWEMTSERLTFAEAMGGAENIPGTRSLVLMGTGSGLLVLAGLLMLLGRGNLVAGVVCLLFGFFLASLVWMLCSRERR